jgi:hypothetical protein
MGGFLRLPSGGSKLLIHDCDNTSMYTVCTLYPFLYGMNTLIDLSYLRITPKINRHESNPNDTGGIHGEPDELCFVEVLGDVPRFDGVQGAESDEEEVEGEGDDHPLGGGVADQHGTVHGGVVEGRTRGL